MFGEVGLGNQLAPIVARRFINQDTLQLDENIQKQIPFSIKGTEGVVIQFAKCCCPVPGDLIEGILTVHHGISVHRAECKNLQALSDQPNQRISLSWANKTSGEFEANLLVEVIDQKGSLARLAEVIANAESNIKDIKITEEPKGQYAILNLIISVKNRTHLEQVMHQIYQLPIVTKVSRV